MTAPDSAIVQIDTAARAVKMAALEADLDYSVDRIDMMRSLVHLLQNSRELADVVTRHAATDVHAGGGRLERQHHHHLDVMTHHLRRARAALIVSCASLLQQHDTASGDTRPDGDR